MRNVNLIELADGTWIDYREWNYDTHGPLKPIDWDYDRNIEIVQHPAEVIEVDPQIIEQMKQRLSEQSVQGPARPRTFWDLVDSRD